jgi:thioredoxin reductase
VIVIGDGPGGMSAALFLAKNKLDVVVFGDDSSAMNYALLRNWDPRDPGHRIPGPSARPGGRGRRAGAPGSCH